MLNSCQSANTQWNGGIGDLIDRWLKERQELIVLYCSINSLPHYSPKDIPTSVKIQQLCQVLMDYMSAGHFEVYEKMLNEVKRSNANVSVAEQILPEIEQTTRLAVDFNDRYDSAEHCIEQVANLPKDLSDLGEALEHRFQLEDQLIKSLSDLSSQAVA